MNAVIPQLVVDLGVIAATASAVFAAGKTPPVRWLWFRLVKGPATEWLRRTSIEANAPIEARLAAIEHEMHPNGGDGLRDQVDHLVIQMGEVRRNFGV